jgi:hypothetical protein
MATYKSKYSKIKSSSHSVLLKETRKQFHTIQKKNPRRVPYVRSAYFTKDKIFISLFWAHLQQKRAGDQVRRLQLYTCAIDLIRNSNNTPETIFTYTDKDHALHRFEGVSSEGTKFYVQIRENKRTNRKDFMSCFPAK